MASTTTSLLPLAALGAPVEREEPEDLPLAGVPRVPPSRTFGELLNSAVGWSRR